MSSLPPLAPDGGAGSSGNQPHVFAAAPASAPAPADGEVGKPEIGIQVLDALLAPHMTDTPDLSAKPASALGGVLADYAMNAAPSNGGAKSGAGGGLKGSDDPSASVPRPAPVDDSASPNDAGGGSGKSKSLFSLARIIPAWHIIPKIKSQ